MELIKRFCATNEKIQFHPCLPVPFQAGWQYLVTLASQNGISTQRVIKLATSKNEYELCNHIAAGKPNIFLEETLFPPWEGLGRRYCFQLLKYCGIFVEIRGRIMTQLLEKAFSEASRLPAKEQNTLAKRLLAELNSEQRWGELFLGSEGELAKLAKETLSRHRAGKTEYLDTDKL